MLAHLTPRRKSHQGDSIKNSQELRKKSVLFKAFLMSLGTLSSRFLGLFREVLLAALFDRTVTDAWSAAFKIPNLFRRLLGEGSLSVSFQPVLIEAQNEDLKSNTNRAVVLSETLHAFLIGLLTLLTLVGVLFSHEILGFILDSDYVARVEAFELTVRLAKIMFGFLFFISLFAYYMAILNANGYFGWPAIAPVFFNISLIVSTLMPQNLLDTRGDFLAWGVLLGGFLQMFVLIPPLIKLGLFPKFQFQFSNPHFLKVLRNMVPGFFGLGLSQITVIVNIGFASSLGEGVISYINWADRLLELPLSLISVSLGTALLPTLSQYWAQGDHKGLAENSERFLSLNLFLSTMAAIGLYVLSEPIVRLLFERGQFDYQDSLGVILVVQIYALSMIPISLVRVLAPSYYAVKNTWYPAVVSAACLCVHLLLAPRLMSELGLQGLLYSSLVSATLNFTLLIFAYSWLITKFVWLSFLWKSIKVIFAAAVMYFIMSELLKFLAFMPGNTLSWLIQVMVVGFSGLLCFFLVSTSLRHQETQFILNQFLKRLGR